MECCLLGCLLVGLLQLFVPKIHGTDAYDLDKIENLPCHAVGWAGNRVPNSGPDLYRGCSMGSSTRHTPFWSLNRGSSTIMEDASLNLVSRFLGLPRHPRVFPWPVAPLALRVRN